MANLLYLVIGFVGVAFTGNIYSDDFDPDEVLSISNKAILKCDLDGQHTR